MHLLYFVNSISTDFSDWSDLFAKKKYLNNHRLTEFEL